MFWNSAGGSQTLYDANGNVIQATNPLPERLFDGAGNALGTVANPLSAVLGAPPAANVLCGYQTFAATTAATTLITIPAGRTWQGWIVLACACWETGGTAASASAQGVVSVAGAGATPSGNIAACRAFAGQNVATGTVGTQGSDSIAFQISIVAPAGNAVTVQVATTQGGTATTVDASAIGTLF